MFLDYEFSILDTKISCLKNINQNKLCDVTLSKLQKKILIQILKKYLRKVNLKKGSILKKKLNKAGIGC